MNDNTDRIRTQAILLHIYHLALHNKWFEARDLMLMSHLQDSVTHADVPTQVVILFIYLIFSSFFANHSKMDIVIFVCCVADLLQSLYGAAGSMCFP